jgi:hypothetical protein
MFELDVAPALPLQPPARPDLTDMPCSNQPAGVADAAPVSMRHLKVAVNTKVQLLQAAVLRSLGS